MSTMTVLRALCSFSIFISSVQSQTFTASTTRQYQSASIVCTSSTCVVNCRASYGCERLSIDASSATDLTLTCSGTNSCQSASIRKSATTATTITCTSKQSCYYASFDVTNSESVHLTCDYDGSSWQGACYLASIRADGVSNLDITCGDRMSCDSTNIYASTVTNLALSCSEPYSCQDINVQSNAVAVDIQCTAWSSCDSGVFDLTGSTSVDFTCNNGYDYYASTIGPSYLASCNSADVTVDDVVNLTVNCMGSYDCYNAKIYADYASSVNVNCSEDDATNSIKVYAEHAEYFVYNSHGHRSQSVQIHAQNAGSVALECEAEYACYYMQFYGDRANSVTLHAAQNHAFSYGTFKVAHVGTVSIRCASDESSSACHDSHWYLPAYATSTDFEFLCYGTGCDNLGDIYVNTTTDIYGLSMSVNGCGDCSSVDSCLSTSGTTYIHMHCTSFNASEYSLSNYFYGSYCSLGDVCGCTDFRDMVSFTDDESNAYCVGTNDSQSAPAASTTLIVVIVVGLLLVCVGGALCWYRRGNRVTHDRKMARRHNEEIEMKKQQPQHQQQEDLTAGGDQEGQRDQHAAQAAAYGQEHAMYSGKTAGQTDTGQRDAFAPSAPGADAEDDAPPAYEEVMGPIPGEGNAGVTNY